MRKQQVDKTLGGRLRFMVGQPGTLVGLDDHVLRLPGIAHHEVQPHHRYLQCPRSAHGSVCQYRVQAFGHVFQGAAGVQVGGAPHGQALVGGQYVVIAKACRP